ncbi:hypothetical protein JRG18_12280 [Kocuria palustris]|uniref:hypothetical protein n=1 Tax=Kocuria palustris TaxID=71999 RepID=UPI0019D0B9BE|nr:hypothetical protein [Kocuria palustris]MBN6754266.1 hypothetical protein [Kocuria palustris]MBN6759231.1 hypothetical protein [Kocuria palustris]MBN6764271.1 hypothetical protein [Kocuria palustris]MBN6783756.1 hypothetical protein [Kocuria palustris]MBN6800238.1 hypothetical protein [Kocuria palustris]
MHSPTTDAQQHWIDQIIDQAPAPDLESALPKLLRADPGGARSRAYLQTHLHHPAMADADHLACAALIVRELEQRRLAALTPPASAMPSSLTLCARTCAGSPPSPPTLRSSAWPTPWTPTTSRPCSSATT